MKSHGNELIEIPYKEFGELRFLDFFSRTDQYSIDEDGCVEIPGLGLACSEGSIFTYFARCTNSEETAVIDLDFDHDCQELQGNALLKYLGLPIQKGMDYPEIKRSLGIPINDFGHPSDRGGATEVQYVIGLRWRYYLNCFIRERQGLSRVHISRKDLVDRFEEWESSL
jgi:hypothetical protein